MSIIKLKISFYYLRCLKQKVKEQEEELTKLKTKNNDVEGKAKTLAEQETDQQNREQILVEKEAEMENKTNEIEREREKLVRKADAVNKSVLNQIPNNWMTSEGHTMKTTLERTIQSIIESEDEEGMSCDEESGINTLESGHHTGMSINDQANMELGLPDDLQGIPDKDLNMELLNDNDNEGETQVRNTN